jgi:hypothetical protein
MLMPLCVCISLSLSVCVRVTRLGVGKTKQMRKKYLEDGPVQLEQAHAASASG